jgi:hypothetical protein
VRCREDWQTESARNIVAQGGLQTLEGFWKNLSSGGIFCRREDSFAVRPLRARVVSESFSVEMVTTGARE